MRLYIIPTPIGNLKDITLRAIETLKKIDLILAEDTRKTKILLNHFSINTKMESYHKFNEHKKTANIINKLKSGINIALVTDAGTPGISDPGFLIVREAVKNNINIETLPGATAFIPALINSALPCDKFIFEGFLPQKKGRQKRLKQLQDQNLTMIFYESPYRIKKAVDEFIIFFGEQRNASISKEISKIHEQTIRGKLFEIKQHFQKNKPKGEFVIIIEGKSKK